MYVDDIPLRHATQNHIVMVPVTNTSTKDEGVSAMPLQLSRPKVENNTMKIKNYERSNVLRIEHTPTFYLYDCHWVGGVGQQHGSNQRSVAMAAQR